MGLLIEKVIYDHLAATLSVPLFFERQKDMPETFVLLEKTGSSKRNYLSSSTFAFQSYASTLFGAAQLNEEVKEKVETLIELNDISGVNLNSDYNFTDTTRKGYRYQAIFDINHY